MKNRLFTLLLSAFLSLGSLQMQSAKAEEAHGALELRGVTLSDAYPNPSNSFVNFNYSLSNLEGEASVEIFNLIGEVVIKERLDSNDSKTRISVNKLEKGIYFYRLVVNGHKSHIKKLLVQ